MAITYAYNGIWLAIGAALFAGAATAKPPPGVPPQSRLPYAQPGQHHGWGPYPAGTQWPQRESGSSS